MAPEPSPRPPEASPGSVRLEYFSWLCRELGLGEEGSVTVELPIVGDQTVRALLAHLAAGSDAFRRLVYDVERDRLREYVTLIVNGRVVELVGGLGARLRPGDQLVLLPGFSGG